MAAHWEGGATRRRRRRDEDVRLKRNENQSIHLQSKWAPEVIIRDIKHAASAEELINKMVHERGGTTQRENGGGDDVFASMDPVVLSAALSRLGKIIRTRNQYDSNAGELDRLVRAADESLFETRTGGWQPRQLGNVNDSCGGSPRKFLFSSFNAVVV